MYLGPPCYGYALNCHLVYLAIPGTRPLCMKKQNMFVLSNASAKSEIQICSNEHETGLVNVYIVQWFYFIYFFCLTNNIYLRLRNCQFNEHWFRVCLSLILDDRLGEVSMFDHGRIK